MTTQNKLVEPIVWENVSVIRPEPADVIDLLGDLARAYTRHHGDLKVCGVKMTGSIALSLQGNRDDHGRLVGSQGCNIWALQTIFTRIGRKMQLPVRMTLIPPTVGMQEKLKDFEADPNYVHGATSALLRRALSCSFAMPYTLVIADVGEKTEYEITPDPAELPIIRGDLAKAFHNIFHAIGKTRGRIIHINLNDLHGENDAAPTNPPEGMTTAPPLPKTRGVRKPTTRREELDDEAKDRGLTT